MNVNAKTLVVSLLLGLMMLSLASAATSWDASALRTSSPVDRFFPKGYEVVTAPSSMGEVIKEMPAGEAKVAAYLDVGGQRYYMTDWSYDRYRQGLSYNWVRAKEGGEEMKIVIQQEKPEIIQQVSSRVPKLGDPLSVWLRFEHDELEFIETTGGKFVRGVFESEDGIETAVFPVPSSMTLNSVSDPAASSLVCQVVSTEIYPADEIEVFQELYGDSATARDPELWSEAQRDAVGDKMIKEVIRSTEAYLNLRRDAGAEWVEDSRARNERGNLVRLMHSGKLQAKETEIPPSLEQQDHSIFVRGSQIILFRGSGNSE